MRIYSEVTDSISVMVIYLILTRDLMQKSISAAFAGLRPKEMPDTRADNLIPATPLSMPPDLAFCATSELCVWALYK
jgi:hypothetical protein